MAQGHRGEAVATFAISSRLPLRVMRPTPGPFKSACSDFRLPYRLTYCLGQASPSEGDPQGAFLAHAPSGWSHIFSKRHQASLNISSTMDDFGEVRRPPPQDWADICSHRPQAGPSDMLICVTTPRPPQTTTHLGCLPLHAFVFTGTTFSTTHPQVVLTAAPEQRQAGSRAASLLTMVHISVVFHD